MSGFADRFVSNGEHNIYQEIYEHLQSSTTSKTTTHSTCDMYGDSDISSSVTKQTSSSAAINTSSTVLWEYTTNENSTENLERPLTTEQMICLTNTEGKLDNDKVRCHCDLYLD